LNTVRQEDRLRQYLLRNPFKTAKEVKKEVPGWSNIAVRTIQMVCQKRLGLPSWSAAKKPLLDGERLGASHV
jgi:hypothetical protein